MSKLRQSHIFSVCILALVFIATMNCSTGNDEHNSATRQLEAAALKLNSEASKAEESTSIYDRWTTLTWILDDYESFEEEVRLVEKQQLSERQLARVTKAQMLADEAVADAKAKIKAIKSKSIKEIRDKSLVDLSDTQSLFNEIHLLRSLESEVDIISIVTDGVDNEESTNDVIAIQSALGEWERLLLDAALEKLTTNQDTFSWMRTSQSANYTIEDLHKLTEICELAQLVRSTYLILIDNAPPTFNLAQLKTIHTDSAQQEYAQRIQDIFLYYFTTIDRVHIKTGEITEWERRLLSLKPTQEELEHLLKQIDEKLEALGKRASKQESATKKEAACRELEQIEPMIHKYSIESIQDGAKYNQALALVKHQRNSMAFDLTAGAENNGIAIAQFRDTNYKIFNMSDSLGEKFKVASNIQSKQNKIKGLQIILSCGNR